MDQLKKIANVNLINSEVISLKKLLKSTNDKRVAVIKELRDKTNIDKQVLIDLIDNDNDNSKLIDYTKTICSSL